MDTSLILGIDSGNTVTKAAIFTTGGEVIAVASCEVAQLNPRPRVGERDMEARWQVTARAIQRALDQVPGSAARTAAVAVTGHGDGLYLVDAHGAPLGPGILSLDTRAAGQVERWQADGTAKAALAGTGQMPYPPAPSALLAWIRDHEPDRFARIGHILSCKDWLRFRLTGGLATDWTEASTSFADPASQAYSDAALELFGLAAVKPALPEAHNPAAIIGHVTADAAQATGLLPGTPVAAGLHDVTASAVGAGVTVPGVLSIIAGSFSINEVISTAPKQSPDWLCRNSFRRGEWMNMALSPASSANIDWFVKQCARDALDQAAREGGSAFDYLEPDIADAFADDSFAVFHPYLYGSPQGAAPTAGFLGLQGWHHRGHMLRALFEGVVFNHRHHVDALRRGFPCPVARLTGGSSRSPRMCQLFADALDVTVETVDVEETGALGAALCGAVGVGIFTDLAEAAAATVTTTATYTPRAAETARLEAQYARYQHAQRALATEWTRLRGED